MTPIPEWALEAAAKRQPNRTREEIEPLARLYVDLFGPEREALEAERDSWEKQAEMDRELAMRCEKERDEARALAEEACRRYNESLRVVTCAFCGEPYPPDTPASGAAVLAEHINVCARHPMREAERERDGAREALRGMLAVYEELHAKYDIGDCDATVAARRALGEEE